MEAMAQLKSSEELQKTIQRILSLSESKKFEIPEDSFLKSVSHEHFWAPPSITPWYYLKSYSLLPSHVQLRYNQLHALAVSEIFALFEQNFLKKIILKVLQQKSFDEKTQQVFRSFCEEEDKHSEMFWRINQACEPDLYPQRDFVFVNSGFSLGRSAMQLVVQFPEVFLMWIWMAIFFEERTLMYSVEYNRDKSPLLSPQFKLLHQLHMMEEARHVQLDEVLIDLLYKNSSNFKRQLCGLTFKKVIHDFAVPKRTSTVIAQILKREFNDLTVHDRIDQCMKELPNLNHNKDFQIQRFGVEATWRTRRVMGMFPEMRPTLDILEGIQK